MLRGEHHYDRDWQARALDQGSLVSAEKTVSDGIINGFLQYAVAEALWRLRHHNARASDRRFDQRSVRGCSTCFTVSTTGHHNSGSMLVRRLDHIRNDYQ